MTLPYVSAGVTAVYPFKWTTIPLSLETALSSDRSPIFGGTQCCGLTLSARKMNCVLWKKSHCSSISPTSTSNAMHLYRLTETIFRDTNIFESLSFEFVLTCPSWFQFLPQYSFFYSTSFRVLCFISNFMNCVGHFTTV